MNRWKDTKEWKYEKVWNGKYLENRNYQHVANFKNEKLFAANYTREKKSYYKNDTDKITDKKTF